MGQVYRRLPERLQSHGQNGQHSEETRHRSQDFIWGQRQVSLWISQGHWEIKIIFYYIPCISFGQGEEVMGFSGTTSGKESTSQCRRCKRHRFDPCVEKIPCSRKNGNLFQYSCLEYSMDRGAWRAAVHGVAKSQT